jgi:hypothetical protein
MGKKTNPSSLVQNFDQYQASGDKPIQVDNTAAGIVLRAGNRDAPEIIESIIVANPTGGGLSCILYMLPIPTAVPTLTAAMIVAYSSTVATVTSAQLLTRNLFLPAGFQLRAVASGAGPLNLTVSGRADELV